MTTYDAPFRIPTWIATGGIAVVLLTFLWEAATPDCPSCMGAPAVLTTFFSLGIALILVGIAYGWTILVLQLRPRKAR